MRYLILKTRNDKFKYPNLDKYRILTLKHFIGHFLLTPPTKGSFPNCGGYSKNQKSSKIQLGKVQNEGGEGVGWRSSEIKKKRPKFQRVSEIEK